MIFRRGCRVSKAEFGVDDEQVTETDIYLRFIEFIHSHSDGG